MPKAQNPARQLRQSYSTSSQEAALYILLLVQKLSRHWLHTASSCPAVIAVFSPTGGVKVHGPTSDRHSEVCSQDDAIAHSNASLHCPLCRCPGGSSNLCTRQTESCEAQGIPRAHERGSVSACKESLMPHNNATLGKNVTDMPTYTYLEVQRFRRQKPATEHLLVSLSTAARA